MLSCSGTVVEGADRLRHTIQQGDHRADHRALYLIGVVVAGLQLQIEDLLRLLDAALGIDKLHGFHHATTCSSWLFGLFSL